MKKYKIFATDSTCCRSFLCSKEEIVFFKGRKDAPKGALGVLTEHRMIDIMKMSKKLNGGKYGKISGNGYELCCLQCQS